METILTIAKQVDRERFEANETLTDQLMRHHKYQRVYKKVVAGLIRTPEKLATADDIKMIEAFLVMIDKNK